MGSESGSGAPSDLPSLESLLTRARGLLDELTRFKEHASKRPYRQRSIPMRDFEGGIRSEITHLEKVASSNTNPDTTPNNGIDNIGEHKPLSGNTAAALRTSNLPSYALIWRTAKSSQGITAFRQWFRINPSASGRRTENKLKRAQKALVDIVAEDGEVWIKVSSITPKRILYDCAKEGWGRFGEGLEGSDAENEDQKTETSTPNGRDGSTGDIERDVPEIPLLRSARDLVAAAKANRVRGRIPQVRLILPRISKGDSSEIDLLLHQMTKLGCTLTLSPEYPSHEPNLEDVLDAMPVNPMARLSTTLNIDCTILISLISDISHVSNLKPESWFNAMLLEQLKFESEEALLPNILYPVLKGRRLVTTEKAAAQCRVIVETIGNENEKKRCTVLLDCCKEEEARKSLQQLSDYDVPADLLISIEVFRDDVVPVDAVPRSHISERLLVAVCGKLSKINGSVFGFGWRTG
ncbi:MAG: hypothetical protein Q9159_002877 [Coniocarpon cinnabarinum]